MIVLEQGLELQHLDMHHILWCNKRVWIFHVVYVQLSPGDSVQGMMFDHKQQIDRGGCSALAEMLFVHLCVEPNLQYLSKHGNHKEQ